MTFIAVPIFVREEVDSNELLRLARAAADGGGQLLEWRVDALADLLDGFDLVQRLVELSPLPSIVTCRSGAEGGEFQGSEEERNEFVGRLLQAQAPPRYIDVEWTGVQRNSALRRILHDGLRRQQEPHRTSLIVSSHDFNGRPADLLQKVEGMTRDDLATVIKLAWRARSLRDNLEAFDLLHERRKPLIALCLGEFGLSSRLLAPKFGGLVTFAALAEDRASAPGQPSLDEIRSMYRFDSIGSETRVLGVIGWPVGHSRSPAVHNAAFTATGFDGVYLPLPIPPEYEHFKATVGALIDHAVLSFSGASVTIPHKENLVRFVAERGGTLDATAEAIGAANTLLVKRDGSMMGLNTDAPAAAAALRAACNDDPDALKNSRAAVIGAGGVASAVVWGLVQAGCSVTVFNRSRERAERLAERINSASPSGAGEVKVGDEESLHSDRFDIYVNATPVGMEGGPAPEDSPLAADIPLGASTIVFDTVYAPLRTPLVREAELRGAKVVSGLDMFLRQAALQFEQWTGQPAPLAVFRDALRREERP